LGGVHVGLRVRVLDTNAALDMWVLLSMH
jgi:hypothetical protein